MGPKSDSSARAEFASARAAALVAVPCRKDLRFMGQQHSLGLDSLSSTGKVLADRSALTTGLTERQSSPQARFGCPERPSATGCFPPEDPYPCGATGLFREFAYKRLR